jgi:tRNA-splicing ligase RtcB
MISQIKGDQVPIKLWAPVEEVESGALDQLRNVARLPWVAHHVAVMPDVHVGKGATVGSVVAMRGAIAPAAVGVDIGCGMAAVKTSLSASWLPDQLRGLRHALERAIPLGPHQHDQPVWSRQGEALRRDGQALMAAFPALSPAVRDLAGRAARQLGTLGGGNHFIELCLDTDDGVWLMLHSGSRNIGKSLAEVHMARRRRACRTTRRCAIATCPPSSPARRRWRPTATICSGRRPTPPSTVRSCSRATSRSSSSAGRR